jgi:heavy metal translocating P-type ATPase
MSTAEGRACDYCGLPVPKPLWGGSADPGAPGFCCFGCRFAAAVTRSRGEEGAATWTLARLGLAIFLTMNVMVFTMALWTQDFYGDGGGEAWIASLRGLFRYLSLLFALPVLLILGRPLLESAWQALRRGERSTDPLLLVGVAASYVYSAVSVFRDEGPVYFEVGCMVLVLVTLGRWLEATGKLRTTAAIEALHQLLPNTARLLRPSGEESIPLAEVATGDLLRVLPGERIPCDGVVVRDGAAVDEQVLTGESQPVLKEPGARVLGGTLALDGTLVIETTAPARGGALARLIDLVRKARLTKGGYERLADRLATWFLPAVALLAVAAFAWHTERSGLDQGLLAGLAVLLIACPCALGLATPMAVWAALGQAARGQVLFRNGEALERLATVRAVRLDKTGTLTTGTPTVADFAPAFHHDRETVLATAAALASASGHAHCLAIREFVATLHLPEAAVHDARTFPGRGVHARLADRGMVYLGSPRWLREHGLSFPPELLIVIEKAYAGGLALTCLGWDGLVRGVFILREQLRPEAVRAVAALRALGLDVAVLTGDHAERGRALGQELGVAVAAEQLPEEKVAAIERVRREIGPVAMVGDGINDAPALAASDVGIALGCGADVSRESAAVCLLGNDLLRLPWAIVLARRTVRIIRGNLFWAFAYNVAGLGFACTGRLNPVLASLAMVLSSLFVVTNSLRLTGSAEEQTS